MYGLGSFQIFFKRFRFNLLSKRINGNSVIKRTHCLLYIWFTGVVQMFQHIQELLSFTHIATVPTALLCIDLSFALFVKCPTVIARTHTAACPHLCRLLPFVWLIQLTHTHSVHTSMTQCIVFARSNSLGAISRSHSCLSVAPIHTHQVKMAPKAYIHPNRTIEARQWTL